MNKKLYFSVLLILNLFFFIGNSFYTTSSVLSKSIQDESPEHRIFFPLVKIDEDFCPTPKLVAPLNNSQINTLVPLFQWDDGNAAYVDAMVLEVYRDPSFKNEYYVMELHGYPGLEQFRFDFNFRPSTTYYWRVYNKCNGYKGPYSDVWSFRPISGGTILSAPSLIAPTHGSLLPTTETFFEWLPVTGANEYCVRWRFIGEPGYGWNWESDPYLFVWGLMSNTTYEWWVTARNDYALGRESQKWEFSTPNQIYSQSAENQLPYVIVDNDGAILRYKAND